MAGTGTETAPRPLLVLPPDNDHRSSGTEVNGDAPAAVEQNGLDASSEGGGNAGNCDTHNKIVIKSKRATGEPEHGLSVGTNELVPGNELDDIQRLYETKPEAFRQWLLQRAPSDLLTRLRHQESASRQFVSSDLFHRWIAFSPTKVSRAAVL